MGALRVVRNLVIAGAVCGGAVFLGRLLQPAEERDWGMAHIAAGEFVAGEDNLTAWVGGLQWFDASRDHFALPAQKVTMHAFEMDRTEVTVAAYAKCVTAGACSPAGDAWRCSAGERLAARSGLPITCVSYEQAAAYCTWAGKRLPTELEWEYAARGTEGRSYPWGEAKVNASRICSRQAEPCPVGSRPEGATPEGVLDLAGNVWEWTQSDHCGRKVTRCPSGAKVVKGGPLTYQHDEALQARSAFRQSVSSRRRDWDLGFRCARGSLPFAR